MTGDRLHVGIASLLRRPDQAGERRTDTKYDWQDIAETAVRDGLGGLVLEALGARRLEVPLHVRRRLELASRSVARRNDVLSAATESLVSVLNAKNVPVLLLKGAALNLSCYVSRGLRPMSDVDLLVRVEDARRAMDVLKTIGCHEGVKLLRDDFFPRFYYETELVTSGPDPVRIDLHARPLRPVRYARLIDEGEFWKGARSVSPGASRAFVPAAETMLIHLASHAAFHGGSRLIWLYDLDRWVRAFGSALDWERFDHLCASWRLSAAVSEALGRAEQLFGRILPDGVRDRLVKQRVDWRDRLTLRQAPHDAASPWRHVVTNVLCASGVRFRLAYLLAHLRPGRGHLADAYPYRHLGWPWAASIHRLARAALRLFGVGVRRAERAVVLESNMAHGDVGPGM